MSTGIRSNVKLDNDTERSILIGEVGENNGKAFYITYGSKGDQKAGCVLQWGLEIEKIQDAPVADEEVAVTPVATDSSELKTLRAKLMSCEGLLSSVSRSLVKEEYCGSYAVLLDSKVKGMYITFIKMDESTKKPQDMFSEEEITSLNLSIDQQLETCVGKELTIKAFEESDDTAKEDYFENLLDDAKNMKSLAFMSIDSETCKVNFIK